MTLCEPLKPATYLLNGQHAECLALIDAACPQRRAPFLQRRKSPEGKLGNTPFPCLDFVFPEVCLVDLLSDCSSSRCRVVFAASHAWNESVASHPCPASNAPRCILFPAATCHPSAPPGA